MYVWCHAVESIRLSHATQLYAHTGGHRAEPEQRMGRERARERAQDHHSNKKRSSLPSNLSYVATPTPSPMIPPRKDSTSLWSAAIGKGGVVGGGGGERAGGGSGEGLGGMVVGVSSLETAELEARLAGI